MEEETTYEMTTMRPNLVALALEKGAGLDQIERLMALQERHEANEAKKAYVVAMAAFKADPPKIEKTKLVSFSGTNYKHALLADAAEKINKALSRHGLSAGWTTKQEGDNISVTCTITHNMGHSESTSLTAGPDKSGAKNAIQAIGSTVSYLERYTLFALTGLASHDQDDDGVKSEAISEAQENELHALIIDNELNADGKYLPRLLKYLKVESLSAIRATNFDQAKKAINEAIARRAAK